MAGRMRCDGGPLDGCMLSVEDTLDLCHIHGPVWGRWFYEIAPQTKWEALLSGRKHKEEIPLSTFCRYEYMEKTEERLVYVGGELSFAEFVESCRPQKETTMTTDEIAGQLAAIIDKALRKELKPDESPIVAGGASVDLEFLGRHSSVLVAQCRLPAALQITREVEKQLAAIFDERQIVCKAVPTEKYGRCFQVITE